MFCTNTVRSMDIGIKYWALCKASGSSLVAPVLAGLVFLRVKMKIIFYENQEINKSASMIFGPTVKLGIPDALFVWQKRFCCNNNVF